MHVEMIKVGGKGGYNNPRGYGVSEFSGSDVKMNVIELQIIRGVLAVQTDAIMSLEAKLSRVEKASLADRASLQREVNDLVSKIDTEVEGSDEAFSMVEKQLAKLDERITGSFELGRDVRRKHEHLDAFVTKKFKFFHDQINGLQTRVRNWASWGYRVQTYFARKF